MKFDKIDAVVKLTERCNINCTYCYMFNKGSSLYESKPKQMNMATYEAIARFLVKGAQEVGASILRIVFHGGEPTMIKPSIFAKYCDVILAEAKGKVNVELTIQTNAVLINDEWIDVFETNRVHVGISLDGDRTTNDRHRVDHAGRGTYDRTIAGVRRLFEASRQGRIGPPALLCVLNPDEDGAKTFNHFAKDIGFEWMDFLLPIETRDTTTPEMGAKVGRYLEGVFRAWNELGNPDVTVRFFDQFYTFMTGYSRMTDRKRLPTAGTLIISISTDGTFGPDDTLRVVNEDYFGFDCRTTSLFEYLTHPLIHQTVKAASTLPADCRDCAWAGYCVGGAANGRLVNRYSEQSLYDEKSILCDGFTHIYAILARALMKSGYPKTVMLDRLEKTAERLQ